MFAELRLTVEGIANKPSIPGAIRNALMSIVAFTCRLAPPQRPTAQ